MGMNDESMSDDEHKNIEDHEIRYMSVGDTQRMVDRSKKDLL